MSSNKYLCKDYDMIRLKMKSISQSSAVYASVFKEAHIPQMIGQITWISDMY